MIILSSPAKTQNFAPEWQSIYKSTPEFLNQTKKINQQLNKLTINQLSELYHSSKKIAELNYTRIHSWKFEHNIQNSKPAILAYAGDIFKEMTPYSYSTKEQEYAQKSAKIISGLYGIIKAYDLIQPYRLEMKTKLKIEKFKDLYEYWQPILTQSLNSQILDQQEKYLVNLASEESYKAIKLVQLNVKIITVEFREDRNGKLENVGIFSKKARGMMLEFMIKNQIEDPLKLQKFTTKGYKFLKWENNSIFFVR